MPSLLPSLPSRALALLPARGPARSARRVSCTRLAATAAAATAILAACADAPTGPLAPGVAHTARASASVERPWRGRCDVTSEFTGAATLRTTGTCQLAHLGRTTVVSEETFTPTGPLTSTLTSTTTYTAANGDRLETTLSASSVIDLDGTATITGTSTVVGGTGRFVGASGTAGYAGTARYTGAPTAQGSFTLDGHLAY